MDAAPSISSSEGLARRQGQRIVFARDLLDTLRRRELDAAGAKLSAETGLPYHAGRERASTSPASIASASTLASGRFAMIDDGLGFQLVPWSPSLERKLGQHVSESSRRDGGGRLELRAQARAWL